MVIVFELVVEVITHIFLYLMKEMITIETLGDGSLISITSKGTLSTTFYLKGEINLDDMVMK